MVSSNEVFQEVNREIGKLFNEMRYEYADNKRKFPNGFKWHYAVASRESGQRDYWYCWSTTKNANGKFISWVYAWKGKANHRVAEFNRIREHRRKNKAKERAYKLMNQREESRKEGK